MTYFLNQRQDDLLTEMAILRKGSYTNRNGNQSTANLFLLGENECTLSEANYKLDKNGKAYLEIILNRNPEYIIGLKSKIGFVPHTEYVFDYTHANELCLAFDQPLKPQRPDEAFNAYFRRVWRGVNSFVGRKLKVAVKCSKHLKKDEYGQADMKRVYYNLEREVYFYRVEVSYNIKDLNWLDISSAFI